MAIEHSDEKVWSTNKIQRCNLKNWKRCLGRGAKKRRVLRFGRIVEKEDVPWALWWWRRWWRPSSWCRRRSKRWRGPGRAPATAGWRPGLQDGVHDGSNRNSINDRPKMASFRFAERRHLPATRSPNPILGTRNEQKIQSNTVVDPRDECHSAVILVGNDFPIDGDIDRSQLGRGRNRLNWSTAIGFRKSITGWFAGFFSALNWRTDERDSSSAANH